MPEANDFLIVHIMGETDHTSFAFPRSIFDGREETTGAKRFQSLQTIGALLSGDDWEEQSGQEVQPGYTCSDLLMGLAVSVLTGNEAVSATLERGCNMVSLGVFFAPGGEEGKRLFVAQAIGGGEAETFSAEEHSELMIRALRQNSEHFANEIRAGRIAEDSVLARAIGVQGPKAVDPLPTSLQFAPVVLDGVRTMAIVCATDSDLAAGLASVEKLVIGLWSGIVPTPHGGAGYWIWEVGVGTPYRFLIEQFVDIHSFPNADYDGLMAAPQLRFFLRDRETGLVARAILLETESYNLPGFQAMAIDQAARETSHDFDAACRYVMRTSDPETVYSNAA